MWAKYGANKNKIRRDNKVSSFFIYISGAAAKKNIYTDENPILVNMSGSDSFGFSCTGNSGMSGFWIRRHAGQLH